MKASGITYHTELYSAELATLGPWQMYNHLISAEALRNISERSYDQIGAGQYWLRRSIPLKYQCTSINDDISRCALIYSLLPLHILIQMICNIWLSKLFLNNFRGNPNLHPKELSVQLRDGYSSFYHRNHKEEHNKEAWSYVICCVVLCREHQFVHWNWGKLVSHKTSNEKYSMYQSHRPS